jgi:hypothetical protein
MLPFSAIAPAASRRPPRREISADQGAAERRAPGRRSRSISWPNCRRHRLLWNRWLDDDDFRPRWRWPLAGHCPRAGIDRRCAAIHLLIVHRVGEESEIGRWNGLANAHFPSLS